MGQAHPSRGAARTFTATSSNLGITRLVSDPLKVCAIARRLPKLMRQVSSERDMALATASAARLADPLATILDNYLMGSP